MLPIYDQSGGIRLQDHLQVDRQLEELDLHCLIILQFSVRLVYAVSLKSHLGVMQSVFLH